ncbi:hypothetical protein [Kitasatospora sp. NPDC085879]|uniref:hypothetical protein n=1 Tax=Kitasatospora sp. NPDC085879 TaxID=3154769 RepID=UPI0034365D7F
MLRLSLAKAAAVGVLALAAAPVLAGQLSGGADTRTTAVPRSTTAWETTAWETTAWE